MINEEGKVTIIYEHAKAVLQEGYVPSDTSEFDLAEEHVDPMAWYASLTEEQKHAIWYHYRETFKKE